MLADLIGPNKGLVTTENHYGPRTKEARGGKGINLMKAGALEKGLPFNMPMKHI